MRIPVLLAATLGLVACAGETSNQACSGAACGGTGGTVPADGGGGASPDGASGGTGGGSGGTGGGPVTNDPNPTTDTEAEKVLRLAIGFYGAERCGDTGNWILADNPVDDKCHMKDSVSGHDLTGGWHDAGDHIKFTLTNAYAAYALLKAYDAFPTAFDDLSGPIRGSAPNGIPDLLDEVKFGTDFLVKAHVGPTTLVTRVGDGRDHDNWVTSPYQSLHLTVAEGGESDGPRPAPTDGKADIAGLSAAALALMARAYQPYDASLAATYLQHAKDLYALGKAQPGTYNGGFYGSSSWVDDMMCGAIELYRATNVQQYLTEAEAYDAQRGGTSWPTDWDNTQHYARHSLAKAGSTAALATLGTDVAGFPNQVSTTGQVAGLAYFSQWGSLRYALGAAFASALHHEQTRTAASKDFALSQLEYAMGDNGFGRSFIVGYGTNPPTRPHHRNAYGFDDNDMDDARPFKHTLYGALVGGPTPDGYVDTMNDYTKNEVALDYNAALVGTAAFAVWLERGP